MKIDKVLKGEKFRYYVELIPCSLQVYVRYFHTDKQVLCDISSDHKYILLPDTFKHFINGEYISPKKLKLSKGQQYDFEKYYKS